MDFSHDYTFAWVTFKENKLKHSFQDWLTSCNCYNTEPSCHFCYSCFFPAKEMYPPSLPLSSPTPIKHQKVHRLQIIRKYHCFNVLKNISSGENSLATYSNNLSLTKLIFQVLLFQVLSNERLMAIFPINHFFSLETKPQLHWFHAATRSRSCRFLWGISFPYCCDLFIFWTQHC